MSLHEAFTQERRLMRFLTIVKLEAKRDIHDFI